VAETCPAETCPASLSTRLEASRVGRVLISGLIVVVLVVVLVANLPDGRVQAAANRVTQPLANASGLAQRWEIFAPEPRSIVLYLEARVVRADGSVSIWRTPEDGAVFGAYRDYHWRKFVEHAVVRDGSDEWPVLWHPLALYVARQEARHGSRPVRVTLIRRSALEIGPGKGPPYLTPYVETPYYTLRLGSAQ
jgi:hypothetical protein